MILAAGLTPAWQQVYLLDRLQVDAVNRAVQVARCASGKVINVGVALHLLGRESRILSVVGGQARPLIEGDLQSIGVGRRWLESVAATRVCTTALDRGGRQTTEIVENAGPLSSEELDQFKVAFAEEAAPAEFVVLTGSLPAGTPHSFYRELLDSTSAPALLDIRGPELLAALDRRPLVVKPNREELAATLGRPLVDDHALITAMAELNDRGAQWVLISEGKRSVWLRGQGNAYRFEPPQLDQFVNPIGCGDVLAAGVAAAIVDGVAVPEAVRFGIAAAAESALDLLPGRLNPANVLPRMAKIAVMPVE